jgi:hypothetical protein
VLTKQRALAAGCAVGLIVALGSVLVLGPAAGGLPEGTVAVVGEASISEASLHRAQSALLADTSLSNEEARRRALERLIDEELAVQRGLELGIAVEDPRMRALLVEAVLANIEARTEDGPEPTVEELRALYAREPGRFSTDRRVRVRHFVFVGADADHRAHAARRALKTGAGAEGDRPSLVPDMLLPTSKLRDYVGDSVARAAASLKVGEVSPVVRTEAGVHVVVLDRAKGGATPEFETVRDAVEAQWRRERVDAAVGQFLVDMRARVRIVR